MGTLNIIQNVYTADGKELEKCVTAVDQMPTESIYKVQEHKINWIHDKRIPIHGCGSLFGLYMKKSHRIF